MEEATRLEVEQRLGRPFDQVREQLLELFDNEWDEIETVIETASAKRDQSRADVIVELVGKAQTKPAVPSRIRRSLIRWIGKPWRERENPWDRFKDRVPPPPPRTSGKPDDLDEWTPLKPDEEP
ncbi:MAG TPA: hypothetical protein VFA34_16370 [Actinomycetota bacterium]|jgi:hypothetical protein|nr:hypothetical protein [Actinomycetota bacterium]